MNLSRTGAFAALLLTVGVALFMLAFLGHAAERSIEGRERAVERVLLHYAQYEAVDPFQGSAIRFRVDPEEPVHYSPAEGVVESFRESERRGGVDVLEFDGLEFVEWLASVLLEESAFDGRVRVNQPPAAASVNVYFLKGDPERLAGPGFYNNCTMIGFASAILCDAELIKSLVDNISAYSSFYDLLIIDISEPEPSVASVDLQLGRELVLQAVVVWLIGHELGHALLHADVAKQGNAGFLFEGVNSPEERDADMYAVEAVVAHPGLASLFGTALGEFGQQEFRRHFRRKRDLTKQELSEIRLNDFPLYNQLDLDYGRYSVPLLPRALALLDRLVDVGQVDGTGYYRLIQSNVRVSRLDHDKRVHVVTVGLVIAGILVVILLEYKTSRRKTT